MLEETEALRGWVTCPKSHREWGLSLDGNPGLAWIPSWYSSHHPGSPSPFTHPFCSWNISTLALCGGEGVCSLMDSGKPPTWESFSLGSDWCFPLPLFTSLGKSLSHCATHSYSQATVSFSRPLIQGLLQAGPWGSFPALFLSPLSVSLLFSWTSPVIFPHEHFGLLDTVPGLMDCSTPSPPQLMHCKASLLLHEDLPDSSRRMASVPSLNSQGHSHAWDKVFVSCLRVSCSLLPLLGLHTPGR